MLGFHQNVEDNEELFTYLDFIKFGVTLQNTNGDCKYGSLECFKYMIKNTNQKIDLGVEGQT